MEHSLTYSNSIFDALSVLSSFSLTETIWNKYEKYAIRKINDATVTIRGSLIYVKDLTSKQAQKELLSLENLMPVLNNLRNSLEPIDDPGLYKFKSVSIEFLDIVVQLYENIQDIALVHSNYEMSMPVLSNDWDKEENNHWDNY